MIKQAVLHTWHMWSLWSGDYSTSMSRREAWYLEISWGHAHHICENVKIWDCYVGRLVNCSLYRTFARNHAIGRNANGTSVKDARPFFVRSCGFHCQVVWGDTKIYRVSYYELSASACVQDLGSIGHSRDLEPFPKSRWLPVDAFNNGMPWKVYKQMVTNSSKSLTSQVTVTLNANKHL